MLDCDVPDILVDTKSAGTLIKVEDEDVVWEI